MLASAESPTDNQVTYVDQESRNISLLTRESMNQTPHTPRITETKWKMVGMVSLFHREPWIRRAAPPSLISLSYAIFSISFLNYKTFQVDSGRLVQTLIQSSPSS